MNGVNRPGRDAPQAGNQGQQGEGQALYRGVFALPEKVNIRRPPEREYDDGNAILEKHELCAALDLEVQLAMLHAFDTANLGSHGQGGFIATRSHLDSQARFCAAMSAKHFLLRLLGVIVWHRRTLVAGRVGRREASCTVFITTRRPASPPRPAA